MTNKAILEAANEAVSQGDIELFLSHCTDDAKWNFVGDQMLEGKEAIRKYMKDAYIEPPTNKVEKFVSEGEFVTVIGTISMIDEKGTWTAYDYCDIWEFENGKMHHLKAFVI